jgi:hypothetical protein
MQTKQSSASTAVKWTTRANLNVLMILVLIGSLSGCANNPFYHKYVMSGQVVNVDGNDVVVCVADTSELDTTHEFEVLRSVFINGVTEEGESLYRLEKVGKVRLKAIRDQHYAVATIISGEIAKHDMVELSRN